MNTFDRSKKHFSETRILDNPHNLKTLLIKGNGKHKTKNISICSNPILNGLDSNHNDQESKVLDFVFASSFIDDTFDKLKKLLFEKEPASKRLSKLLIIKDDFIGSLKAEIGKSLKILSGEDTYSAVELSSQRKGLNSSEIVNFNVFNKRKQAAPHPLKFINTNKKELNISSLISRPTNKEDNQNRLSIEGNFCSREAPSLEQYISKAPKKMNPNNSIVKGCSSISKVLIKKKINQTNNTTAQYAERSCSSREGYSSKLTNRSKEFFSMKCKTAVSASKQIPKVVHIESKIDASENNRSLNKLRAIIQSNFLSCSSAAKNDDELNHKIKGKVDHFKNNSGISLERFLSGNASDKQRDIIIKKRAQTKPTLLVTTKPSLPDQLIHKKNSSCQNGSKFSKVFLEFGIVNQKTKTKVNSLATENSVNRADVCEVMNKVKLSLEQNYSQHLNFSYNDFYLTSKHQTLNSSQIED